MKLTVDRKQLQSAVAQVTRSVGRGDVIPILGNVRLRADGSSLSIAGCDLDMLASATVAADVDEPGDVTVPGKILQGLVSRTSVSVVKLIEDATKGVLTILMGRSKIDLLTLSPRDFPDLPFEGSAWRGAMEARAFSRLLHRVEGAASTTKDRLYLRGVHLCLRKIDGQELLLAVATDGHRLMRHAMAIDGSQGVPSVIVPSKAVTEIIRVGIEAGGNAVVEISGNGNLIRATFDSGVCLTSKLIDGVFPDFERLIPVGNSKKAIIDRSAFEEAMRRAALFGGAKSFTKLDLTNGGMSITSRDANGEAVDEIDVEIDEAASMSIGFAAGYLADMLSAFEGDRLQINLDSPGSPTLFRDCANNDLLGVLMPRRS